MSETNSLKLSILTASAAIFLSIGGNANAAIVNGGFESGALSPWSSLGNAGVATSGAYSVGTVSAQSGNYAAQMSTNGISAATLASQMGISESALEASNGGTNATNGSMIYQSTSANAGDSFTFKWNFVEQDYVPYDDWAFYGISLNGGPASVTKFASLATVGAGTGSTINGWETLTVNITQSGNYTFYFGIVNALDTSLNSDLWIDGITGTGSLDNSVPEPGTLALLGLGLLGAAASRRKTNSKA